MSDGSTPCVLIASCSKREPEHWAKLLLKPEEIAKKHVLLEQIGSYPLHLDTKYYTADINLCVTHNRTIGDASFAKTVNAFIVDFDPNDSSSFENVKLWLPYLKELGPPVQLLVCDTCNSDTAITSEKVMQWCFDHEFELVQMQPDPEELDDFDDSYGVKRIMQAICAHSWMNMVMKQNPVVHSAHMRDIMADIAAEKENSQKNNDPSSVQQQPAADSNKAEENSSKTNGAEEETVAEGAENPPKQSADLLAEFEEDELAKALGQADVDDFEMLFANMHMMKSKASALPPEQRHVYAEKVALAFWKAIGGEEEEASLGDLDG